MPGVVRSPIVPTECVAYDLAIERVTDAVKYLLDIGEKLNINLCLENVWNGLFYSPLELKQFIDSFGSPRLGVYLDVGNLLGYHQYPPHWIELLDCASSGFTLKTFITTSIGMAVTHFVRIGEGDVPWPETMKSLRAIGYDKTIVAEMLPYRPGLLEATSLAMDKILKD